MDSSWVISVFLLADADKDAANNQSPGFGTMMLPMVLIVFVWYFLILRPQGQERKQREALLTGLKKNDRVVTISGIIGTVVSFSNDNKEVTLRVDDNVKLKFLRSAIQGPLAEQTQSEDSAKPAT